MKKCWQQNEYEEMLEWLVGENHSKTHSIATLSTTNPKLNHQDKTQAFAKRCSI
jgi:hypothetical protein